MTDTESQRIGRAGENLFRVLLPDGWYMHKRDPDPYVDFIVEPVVEAAQLPISALFQIKSKAEVFGKPKCRIETKTLKFARASRVPVFLALIDTANRVGWFKNLSDMFQDMPLDKPFWDQDTAVLNLDKSHVLSDTDFLLDSITQAWENLDERYPGSIASAASRRRDELEALDPRFSYTVTFNGECESIKCVPKSSEISFGVSVRACSVEGRNKLKEFVDEGGRIDPSEHLEIKVTDAPGSVGKTQSAGIEAYSTTEGDVQWKFYDAKGAEVGAHVFPASWKGGRSKRKASLVIHGAEIFSGTHTIKICYDRKMIENQYSFKVQYSQWAGQDVLRLSGYYQLESVFGNARQASVVKMGPLFGGEWVCAEQSLEDVPDIKNLSEFLNLVGKLRTVSKDLDLEIIFDHEHLDKDIDFIHDLYDGLAVDGFLMGDGEVEFIVGAQGAGEARRNLADGGGIRYAVDKQIDLMGRDCGYVKEITEGEIYDVQLLEISNGDLAVNAKVRNARKMYRKRQMEKGE